jgi:uncharacterized protein (TIGR02594 family)
VSSTLPSPLPPGANEPSWYRIALAEVGVQEVQGAEDNPRIQEYFAATTLGGHVHDETAWCSAFVNWCMKRSGGTGTGRANARSWLGWGQELQVPKLGCIVVFSRDSAGPAAGHVSFFVSRVAQRKTLRVLGGNQGNRVCVAEYPEDRVVGYRWPKVGS